MGQPTSLTSDYEVPASPLLPQDILPRGNTTQWTLGLVHSTTACCCQEPLATVFHQLIVVTNLIGTYRKIRDVMSLSKPIFTECSVRSLYPGLDLGGSRGHNRKGTRGVSGKASTLSGLYLLELRVYARLSPFLGFHPSSRLSKAPTRNSLVTDPTRWLRDTDAADVKVGYVSVRIGCQTMTLVVVTI